MDDLIETLATQVLAAVMQRVQDNLKVSTTKKDNSYSEKTGGVCPLAQSLISFRHHNNLTQSDVVHKLRAVGYKSVHNTTISALEHGAKPFSAMTRDHDEGGRDSLESALSYVFGNKWKKVTSKVKAHGRIKR